MMKLRQAQGLSYYQSDRAVKHWIGSSTDNLPTPAIDGDAGVIPPFSTVTISDSGQKYIWTGANWVPMSEGTVGDVNIDLTQTNALLNQVITKLEAIRLEIVG